MRPILCTTLIALAGLSRASPTPIEHDGILAARQTSKAQVYLTGDSTMANLGDGAKTNTQGWGQYLATSLTVPVVNRATAGRSARSYTVEGRFSQIADLLQPGDYVVIEFGHNDGGSLGAVDNGRTDCAGSGSQTCRSTYEGKSVTVQTFPTYITDAGKSFAAKGAHVIVSSMTPDNPWETGSFVYSPSRFTAYAKQSAAAIGSAASFVDHGAYVADMYKKMGASKVKSFFPNDHTHTSPAGAQAVADAFVEAVLCSTSSLKEVVKNATSVGEGKCLS